MIDEPSFSMYTYILHIEKMQNQNNNSALQKLLFFLLRKKLFLVKDFFLFSIVVTKCSWEDIDDI